MDPAARFAESPDDGVNARETCTADRVPRSHPFLAWLVIALVIAIILCLRAAQPRPSPTDDIPMVNTMMRGEAQYLLVTRGWFSAAPGDTAVALEELDRGGVPQRLRVVVWVAEFDGTQAALARLERLQRALEQQAVEPTVEQREVLDILERLYAGLAAGDGIDARISAAEQQRLVEQLDWFGELALAPDAALREGPEAAAMKARREQLLDGARHALVWSFALASAGCAYALAGGIALVVCIVLVGLGRIRTRWWPAGHGGHGGIYAETFALWMMLLLLMGLARGWITAPVPRLLVSLVTFPASLGALAWPVLRGLSWSQVRADIGWTRAGNGLVDPLRGLLCHMVVVPFVAISVLLISWVLRGRMGESDSFEAPDLPHHPATDMLLTEGGWATLLVFVLAVVIAPIVEETMFRGVLYRHLRECGGGQQWLRIITSMLVCAFVFAVIHPQGALGLPLLMLVALGFAIAREWRDSLFPAMWAHAIHNTIVLRASLLSSS